MIASMLGTGYTPLMPGSAACIIGVLFYICVRNSILFAVITLAMTAIALIVSTPAEKAYGTKDPKFIVIDDFAGMLITYLFVPFSWKVVLIGFFLFRMLDMLKIFPADVVEEYPGALGIVGDDVIAGLYANLALHIALRFVAA